MILSGDDFRDSDFPNFQDTNESTLLNEKFRKIFEDALGALFVVNREGIVEYANKKYLELFKLGMEDVVGKPVPEDCSAGFDYVLRTGESIIGQIFKSHKRLTIINKIAIKKDQKVIGAVGIALFDKLEELEALKKKIANLENKITRYKRRLDDSLSSKYTLEHIIGDSRLLGEAKDLAIKASRTSLPVLILGESGTGKELFAHSIHHESDRRDESFVRVNCAAIPKDLFESELFGYEPGAFTGSGRKGSAGKFELAHEGTIFLDEICEMPLEMQAKLLRVIQEKEVERVGGREAKAVNFRLVSATNRDVNKMLEEGRIREDLYYRINVIRLPIPPLRMRKEDIPLCIDYFLDRLFEEQGVKRRTMSRSAMGELMAYNWAGNVRELKNVVELSAISAQEGDVIRLNDLPQFKRLDSNKLPINHGFLRNVRQDAERRAIEGLLRKTNYCVSTAASMIGMHRTGLYRKIKGYGIDLKQTI